MKVKSSKMYFINGSRVRPGTVFDHPDGKPLNPDMTVVEGGETATVKEPKAPKSKGKAPTTFSEIAKQDSAAMTPKGTEGAADLV